MKKLTLMALTALLATPAAFAADMPNGSVAAYLVQAGLDRGGGVDADGTGFGLRGWATIAKPWFVHGEYQTVSIDFPGPGGKADLESLRLGGGLTGEINQQGLMWLAKAEFIDFGSDSDQAGFGAHGGVLFNMSPMFGMSGTLGYITTDDTDGLELNVGGKLSFTRELAGVADIRNYMGSVDPNGDFDVFEVRVGVAYMF